MKYLFYLIIILFLVIGCDGPYNPFDDAAGKEIYPIKTGDTYIYSVQSQNSTTYENVVKLEYTFLSDTVINDIRMTPQYRTAYRADSTIEWILITYQAQDDFGFYNYLTTPELSYPMPYLRYPIFVGRKWNLTATEYFFNQYDKIEAEVMTKEDVGIYQDCWKVYKELTKSEDETYPVYKMTSWYKDNVGLVKVYQEVGSSTYTIELIGKTSAEK